MVQSARDPDPLPLASRYPNTALPNEGIKPLGQLLYECVQLRRSNRGPDCGIVNLLGGHPKGYVAAKAVIRQIDALRHITDLLLPATQVRLNIAVVYEHGSLCRRQ